MSTDAAASLLAIGLDEKSVANYQKNDKVVASILNVIHIAGKGAPEFRCERDVGVLLVNLATTMKGTPFWVDHSATIVEYVLDGRLSSSRQVSAACKMANKIKKAQPFDAAVFEKTCGVGVTWTREQVSAAVRAVLDANAGFLTENRYAGLNKLMGKVSTAVEWCDPALMQEEVAAAAEAILGPKTAEDLAGGKKKVKAPKKPKAAASSAEKEKKTNAPPVKEENDDDFLMGRHLDSAINSDEWTSKHLAATGGKIITRFPPEPNGFLHAGHAKAMNFNFGVASRNGGHCILRFDDTNPTAEKKLYIDSIVDTCKWLGHKPWKVTYSSDYFDELYELAIKLIKTGYGYVCHQSKAESKANRDHKPHPLPSPYRDRSVDENLRLFDDMRKGKYPEGGAVLRMKGDLTSANPNMWDPVAYRIKYATHPHVGDRWCIYPSYDYTHCIVDSLENITNSLCTLEFEVRRESYYWLLDVLDLYKPKVWEYSRLNIEHNVLSKRKLLKLVNDGIVRGWDDPRLLTVDGLRRRGFTPASLNKFCDAVGVTRTANLIPWHNVEHYVREDLNESAPRSMLVRDPLKIVLTNLKAREMVPAPVHPKHPERGTRDMTLDAEVFIERSDFLETDQKGFFGLALNKEVRLKYAHNITCTKVIKGSNGEVVSLEATVDYDNTNKVKGTLHWVSDPINVEVREYDYLFLSQEPGTDPAVDWTTELNPDSEVVRVGLGDRSLAAAKPEESFQFERLGYFCCDKDSTVDLVVFNRTCELKVRNEAKAAMKGKKNGKKKN